MRSTRRALLLTIGLAATLAAGSARAAIIVTFDDTKEGSLPVSVENAPEGFEVLAPNSESRIIRLEDVLAVAAPNDRHRFFLLTEKGKPAYISDVIDVITIKGSKNLGIAFLSDENVSLPKPTENPPARKIYGMAAETGKIEDIQNPNDIPLPAAGLKLRVGSGLNVVPEPASLVLADVGALALVGYDWLRRRPQGRRGLWKAADRQLVSLDTMVNSPRSLPSCRGL
jgi:hypothetical protein